MESLYSSYQPIQVMIDLLASSANQQPLITPSPIDIYVFNLFIQTLPKPIVLTDYLATASQGTTAVAAAIQKKIIRVHMLQDLPTAQKDILQQHLQKYLIMEKVHDGQPAVGQWMHAIWHSGEDLSTAIAHNAPDLIFLMPVGPVGASDALANAILYCQANVAFRLILVRELSPFLAKSQLAIMCHSNLEPSVDRFTERVEGLFNGNFDFSQLLEKQLQAEMRQSEKMIETDDEMIHYHLEGYPHIESLLNGGFIQTIYHRLVPVERRLKLREIRVNLLGW